MNLNNVTVVYGLVVSTSAIDCLERPVSEMIFVCRAEH